MGRNLIPFNEFFEEEFQKLLSERLLLINKGAKSGQAVILAGGAGSGKGFAIANMIEGSKFKVRDVDELKKQVVKLSKLKNKFPEIRDVDLRNPEDVAKLHAFVKMKSFDTKTLRGIVLKQPGEQLSNIIFDMTLKNMSSLHEIIELLEQAGYEDKNIHVVWVLTDYRIAIKRNKGRDRVVPKDILIHTHSGAAATMFNLISGKTVPKNLDGGIYVILGNPETTVFWEIEGQPTTTIKDFKYFTVKQPGKPIRTEKNFRAELYSWVIKNVPKNYITKGIISSMQQHINVT